jgi:hypothetical protein
MATKFDIILEPYGLAYPILSPPVTTIRSIIEQLECIKSVLADPENYDILWYHNSDGIVCEPQLVNLDTEVHMISDKHNNPIYLYCFKKSTNNININITCDKIYSDNGEFNDKNLIKTTIKLPNIIVSKDQLIQFIALSLNCDPKSILAIYEEDSPLVITDLRIMVKGGDPFQYMTVQVDKKVIIEFYTKQIKGQFDKLLETFKNNLESLI